MISIEIVTRPESSFLALASAKTITPCFDQSVSSAGGARSNIHWSPNRSANTRAPSACLHTGSCSIIRVYVLSAVYTSKGIGYAGSQCNTHPSATTVSSCPINPTELANYFGAILGSISLSYFWTSTRPAIIGFSSTVFVGNDRKSWCLFQTVY